MQSQTFTVGHKRRIFYQPQGTVQTLLQHRKLLDSGQEEEDIGNRGDFSTDHFILSSHVRFSCYIWECPQNCLLWPKEVVEHNAV